MLEKIFQLDRRVQSSHTIYCSQVKCSLSLKVQWRRKLYWTEMYFKDPNFKRKETTLGMVDSLGPKLQDLFWRNLWKSSSIQERRGLWLTVLELQAILDCQVLHLTQQVLEVIKSMVIIFQQASFQYCRLSMDHVSWMNVCQIREKGLLHRTWLL